MARRHRERWISKRGEERAWEFAVIVLAIIAAGAIVGWWSAVHP